MAGIAETSARGVGEARLAAGAQDQGDEQPRLKVREFQYGFKDINKIIRFYFVQYVRNDSFFHIQSSHKVIPNMFWQSDLCPLFYIFKRSKRSFVYM
jgi:hypothetical protein